MKRLVLLLVVPSIASAQPQRMGVLPPISDDVPKVIVLTFGVGPRIFERFGHAAICLQHAPPSEPVCFNYGVTDFDAGPIMIWRFLRSEQRFWVEPESWSSMTRFYESEDRDIWMQPLPLEPAQARAIEARLYHDVEEQNRYYVYDHFFDNCTTRVRDMIDDATGHRLRDGGDAKYPLTFREIGHRGLAVIPPLVGLTDFVIGRQTDDHPTLWTAMFHPEVLRREIEVDLGVAPQLVYARHGPAFAMTGSSFRLQFLLLGLVFAAPLFVTRRRIAIAWATVWLGGWGLAIWTLVAISSIPGVRWNEAVLVFVPLDLALPILGEARRQLYARARVGMLVAVSLLCAIGVLHQPLWIPIATAFAPFAVIALRRPRANAMSGSGGGSDAEDVKDDSGNDQQQVA